MAAQFTATKGCAARGLRVDGARQQLLARAALAQDQHRRSVSATCRARPASARTAGLRLLLQHARPRRPAGFRAAARGPGRAR